VGGLEGIDKRVGSWREKKQKNLYHHLAYRNPSLNLQSMQFNQIIAKDLVFVIHAGFIFSNCTIIP